MSEPATRSERTGGMLLNGPAHKWTEIQQSSPSESIDGPQLSGGGFGDGSSTSIASDESNSVLRLYQPPPHSRRRQKAPALGDDSIETAEEKVELRDACVALAHQARDAFRDACSSRDADEAEASFASARGYIEDLWEFAYLRDEPFRDLLALLDAALKRAELAEIKDTQRSVLIQAFNDLPKWMLEDRAVESHIESFAEHDVDILGPLRAARGTRVRVTFEKIED